MAEVIIESTVAVAEQLIMALLEKAPTLGCPP
jgi:hypothetical protein